MGWIRHELDDLEPHETRSGPCGASIAHRCALFVTCPSCSLITPEDRVGLLAIRIFLNVSFHHSYWKKSIS